jgi:hypothetical protein
MASGRVPKIKSDFTFDKLAVPESDAALGQIVGRELHRDLVASQNANAIAPKSSGKVRQNCALVFQLNTEQAARKLFENGPGYFYTVFFTHSTSLQLAVKRGGRAFYYRFDPADGARPAQRLSKILGCHGYVGRLETLGPLGHFELDTRALIKRTVTVRLNGRKMDEHILARFALNESEALGRVEPLHSTFFSHAKNLYLKITPTLVLDWLPEAQRKTGLPQLEAVQPCC